MIIIAGLYVAMPDWTSMIQTKLNKAIGNPELENGPITQTQAKFVNLDGRVQVKKVNSVTWVEADYHTALDKGDLIQTASDGAARITFARRSVSAWIFFAKASGDSLVATSMAIFAKASRTSG